MFGKKRSVSASLACYLFVGVGVRWIHQCISSSVARLSSLSARVELVSSSVLNSEVLIAHAERLVSAL